MPRVIVLSDTATAPTHDAAPVLLDERVHSIHLRDDHAASQFVERLGWAINDAEDLERTREASWR